MAQTNVNIRMDAELKKQFEAFCSDIGMSMTTAFCVFAKKQFVNAESHSRSPLTAIHSTVLQILHDLRSQ